MLPGAIAKGKHRSINGEELAACDLSARLGLLICKRLLPHWARKSPYLQQLLCEVTRGPLHKRRSLPGNMDKRCQRCFQNTSSQSDSRHNHSRSTCQSVVLDLHPQTGALPRTSTKALRPAGSGGFPKRIEQAGKKGAADDIPPWSCHHRSTLIAESWTRHDPGMHLEDFQGGSDYSAYPAMDKIYNACRFALFWTYESLPSSQDYSGQKTLEDT